jgi:hypothetical protein
LAGIALPYVVTTTRGVGSSNEWFKIYSETTSPSPRTVYLRVTASGDNSSFTGDFIVNLAGYNFQHSIILSDYQYYNTAKLKEVKTVNPGSAATTEIWVRLEAITGSTGTLTVSASSKALVDSLSAGSEPSATLGTAHLYSDSWPSNSTRVSQVVSNGIDFADASHARFRRQDGTRSSFINHDTGGMNIATSNAGDNMDIAVAGGSLDITLMDNYEMAVNEGSAAADFRVESDSKSNMLFVDGSLDFVGIETSTRINSSATAGVLTTAGGICIETQVSGGNGYYGLWLHNNAGTQTGYIYNNGSSTSYNTSSDVRLKQNIFDAEDAGALIDNIQVRSFDWKETGEHQRYGMVAQELQTVVPEAVHQPKDADVMMGVDYSTLVPMLIKEIQSLRARVAQLENT